jgi:anti-sigma B factor antagonist
MRSHVRRIVDLTGDLVIGDGDEVLGEVFEQLLGGGHTKVLLNFAHVGRMDSSGIGELVSGWKRARQKGIPVRLLRPGDRVRHVLHLSQILPLIEVFESESDALTSFATP